APERPRLRPHRPHLLHADPRRRPCRGPPAPPRHLLGGLGGRDPGRPGPRPSRTPRPGRERGRLSLGPRDGAAASGFPLERCPGRVGASPGPAAVRAHGPLGDGAVRGGAALGRARCRRHPGRGRPAPSRGSRMSAAAALATSVPVASTARGRWLVSARWDVAVFGAPALAAFALLVWGRVSGALAGVTPPWAWIATVLAVDVAHVWSTAYRVYLDPEERLRRPALYLGVPLAAYVVGVVLYSTSPGLFW